MKNLVRLSVAVALAVMLIGPASGAAEENPWKVGINGFVVGTLFSQNQTFLYGQGAGVLMAAPPPIYQLPRPLAPTDKKDTFFAADVRQVRLVFNAEGPEAMGAKPKAVVDFDLFGNLGANAMGYESPSPRLRAAYAELKWGNTSADIGQHRTHLHIANTPVSLAHLFNPVTYGAGTIGYRTVGLRALHLVPMGDWKVELGAEVSAGKWNDANNAPYPNNVFPGSTPQTISLAWSSGMPQLGGRVKADGKSGALGWMGFVAGSYQTINLKGFGDTVAPAGVTLQDGSVKKSLTSYAVSAGGNLELAPVTLRFAAYTGRATAPVLGGMLQIGDIGDVGYWAQFGIFATPEISFWATYGASSCNKKDLQNWTNPSGARLAEISANPLAITTLRKDNVVAGGMVEYKSNGYAIAAEYHTISTAYLLGNLTNDDGVKWTSGYQIALSAGYFF